jgi:hypothetical protein
MHTRNFLFNFFDFLKINLKCIFIIGAFTPMSQNTMSGLKAMTYPQFPSAGLTGSVRFRWPPRQGARMPRMLEQWPWHGAEPTILPARAHPLMVLTHQVALASATMRVQHSMV